MLFAPRSVVEHVPVRARLSGLALLGQLMLLAVVPRATIDGHSRTMAPTTSRLVILPLYLASLGRYTNRPVPYPSWLDGLDANSSVSRYHMQIAVLARNSAVSEQPKYVGRCV